jgi:hypothetical protein
MKTYAYLWYLSEFLLEWAMFQRKFVEKTKHAFYVQLLFCFENPAIYDNVEKYDRVRQATDVLHAEWPRLQTRSHSM